MKDTVLVIECAIQVLLVKYSRYHALIQCKAERSLQDNTKQINFLLSGNDKHRPRCPALYVLTEVRHAVK